MTPLPSSSLDRLVFSSSPITLTLALVSTLTLAATAGAADVLISREDTGSAGTPDTSQRSQFKPKPADERVLEQPEDATAEGVATTDTPIADSAVDETARAVALRDLAGGSTTVLTRNQLSIHMNESLYAPGGVQAGGIEPTAAINGRGQLAHHLTEHAQAAHAAATAELAPQATGPHQTSY
jgi:hypothetical protein